MDGTEDFLRRMEIATLDGESWLHEIPAGYFVLGSGLSYGPWPAASCAAVLTVWYRAGLIRLHALRYPEWNLIPSDWDSRLGDGGVLADTDAEDLLDHPERWVRDRADGYVAPRRTWQGEVSSWEQWLTAALDTARRLPLR